MTKLAPILIVMALLATVPLITASNVVLNFLVMALVIALVGQGWNLLGGFTACWRDLFKIVVDAIRLPVRFVDVPYDIAYLRAAFREWRTPVGRERWPNRYAMDVLGRSHLLEDGLSRRELTWSPTIGSLDEAREELVEWAHGARPSRPEKPSEPAPETESLRGPEATSAPPAP